MNQERSASNWNFVLKWVGITTLTMIAGVALAFPTMWSIGEAMGMVGGETIAAVVAGALFGGLIGLGMSGGQAITLNKQGVDGRRWVVFSVLGSSLVTALTFGIAFTVLDPETLSERQAALLIGSALGQGIGAGQWFALRGRVPNAMAWMGITILALVAGTLIAVPLGGEGREFLAFGLMALIAATITGLGAVWLFRGRLVIAPSNLLLLVALGLLSAALVACGSETGNSSNPRVRFAEPRDGATVDAPVQVMMAVENFTVEPAGDGAVHEGAGHLHIMVDTPCITAGQTIPKDETHLHFGDGSTATELALAPGTHTLCLQAADGAHTALSGDGMTHSISITVP